MCKPAARFDLPMLSKQLPYVFRRSSIVEPEESEPGGAALVRALDTGLYSF